MRLLSHHFRRSAWLNPAPAWEWEQQTVRVLRGLFPMYPLTIDGIQAAVRRLLRGEASGPAALP
jgi:uncharacterized protein with von Willebrand factor type A (vWA) domain